MAITTSQPTIIPPTTQVTCDRMWAEQIVINAPVDGQPATVYIVTRPYAEDGDGNKTFAPQNEQRTYQVADLDAATTSTPDVATAYNAVLSAVQAVITAQEQQQ